MIADEVVTWQAAADLLPPEIVAAIVAGPPPTWRERVGLTVWELRCALFPSRGFASVVSAAVASHASTIRALQGR